MNETFEIGFYEFIRSELGNLRSEFRTGLSDLRSEFHSALDGLEARTEKRLTESEARTEKRLAESEARTDKRFDKMDMQFTKLEEEVRWPRRIAIGGVITTVLAVFFAIIGFKGSI